MTDRLNDPTAHDLPTSEEAAQQPALAAAAPRPARITRVSEGEHNLSVGLAYDDGTGTEREVTLLITTTTPGASDGLDPAEPAQPVLVVWGGRTEPLARVALRSGLVAEGWEPYPGRPAEAAPAAHDPLLAGVRMIATLGHSCGLVDPYSGDESRYSPMAAILGRLGEVSPYLVPTWEYQQALARVEGRR